MNERGVLQKIVQYLNECDPRGKNYSARGKKTGHE